jgi:hypothetical protein
MDQYTGPGMPLFNFTKPSTETCVKGFYSYRIWRVSGQIRLAIPAWIFAFARVAVTMTCVAVLSAGKKGYKQFTEKDRFLVDLALVLSMAVRHVAKLRRLILQLRI